MVTGDGYHPVVDSLGFAGVPHNEFRVQASRVFVFFRSSQQDGNFHIGQ